MVGVPAPLMRSSFSSLLAYARVLAALDAELTVVPAVIPTLDEIHGIFD